MSQVFSSASSYFFFTRIILGNIYICGMERVSKLRKLSDKFIEYVVELPTFRLHGLLQLSAYRSTRRIPVLRQLCRSTRNSESHPCRIGYIQWWFQGISAMVGIFSKTETLTFYSYSFFLSLSLTLSLSLMVRVSELAVWDESFEWFSSIHERRLDSTVRGRTIQVCWKH